MALILRRRRITNTRSAANKRIAQRTCVACHRIKDKRELVRLVRTPEGNIEIDSRGKKEGRGAYLCPTRECWEAVLKGDKLEHALRGSFTQDDRKKFIKRGQGLLKGVE